MSVGWHASFRIINELFFRNPPDFKTGKIDRIRCQNLMTENSVQIYNFTVDTVTKMTRRLWMVRLRFANQKCDTKNKRKTSNSFEIQQVQEY